MSFLLTILAWLAINHYPSYASFSDTSPRAGDLATCAFPQSHYPAFLVCTQAQDLDLTGATIVCQFTVEASPDCVFRFAGEDTWNTGPRPASARLFFSTLTGYSNMGSNTMKEWFNVNWVEISTNSEMLTLVATFSPEDWTDAGGCDACPPPTTNDFWNAVQNIHEIGIAFGGGDFYDVGIATTTGAALLHLNRFAANPKFPFYRRCFSE